MYLCYLRNPTITPHNTFAMVTAPDLSPTVLECFNQKLPQLGRSLMIYKTVKASSTTTANTVPPHVLLCKQHDLFQQHAEDCLKKDRTQKSEYSQQPIGPEFKQIKLDNEADLVFASAIFVIKPILNIISIWYNDNITVTSDQTAKIDLLGDNEKATRVDLVFRSAKDNRIILILEYKRRELIMYEKFRGALLSKKEASDNDIRVKIRQTKQTDRKTLLLQNALVYTKQVASYAEQFGCEDIALLNWDHLLLYEFNKRSEGKATKTTAGETAELGYLRAEIWMASM
jgi:hypothetical protein